MVVGRVVWYGVCHFLKDIHFLPEQIFRLGELSLPAVRDTGRRRNSPSDRVNCRRLSSVIPSSLRKSTGMIICPFFNERTSLVIYSSSFLQFLSYVNYTYSVFYKYSLIFVKEIKPNRSFWFQNAIAVTCMVCTFLQDYHVIAC